MPFREIFYVLLILLSAFLIYILILVDKNPEIDKMMKERYETVPNLKQRLPTAECNEVAERYFS